MVTSMSWLPFPLDPRVPVTPPPDHQSFSLAQGPPPLSPNLLKSFTQEIYGNGSAVFGHGLGSGLGYGLKSTGLQAQMMMNQQRPAPGSVAAGVSNGRKNGHSLPPPPWQRQQQQQQQQNKPPFGTAAERKDGDTSLTKPAASTTSPSTSEQTTVDGSTAGAATTTETAPTTATPPSEGPLSASDPRYLAMASRIAAYYQQRCQAVANFQQQRCQAWANTQRQKSQEMTQAAMLVVAWYIRDRIQRRRRREKRHFRRGLAARAANNGTAGTRASKGRGGSPWRADCGLGAGAAGGRVTKGEAVRKWVLQIPEGSAALPPSTPGSRDKPADPDEVSFDMDRDTVSDKDARVYNVADNLIKSQLARIDVPMMGALSFDPSEGETDSEEEEEEDNEDEEEEEDGEDEDEMMANYEERGARIEAVAVGVEAIITDATTPATGLARARLAGAAPRAAVASAAAAAPTKTASAPVDDLKTKNNKNKNTKNSHNECDMEDDDDDDDDDEFEDDEVEEDSSGQQGSELVHHGTGAGSGRSQPETSCFS